MTITMSVVVIVIVAAAVAVVAAPVVAHDVAEAPAGNRL